jgi:hypothetical protein
MLIGSQAAGWLADRTVMSLSGSPISGSIVQAAQAQQVAARGKDRQRAIDESARRFEDLVDLSVAGTETGQAIRRVPENQSEQADAEEQPKRELAAEADQRPRIDLRA